MTRLQLAQALTGFGFTLGVLAVAALVFGLPGWLALGWAFIGLLFTVGANATLRRERESRDKDERERR